MVTHANANTSVTMTNLILSYSEQLFVMMVNLPKTLYEWVPLVTLSINGEVPLRKNLVPNSLVYIVYSFHVMQHLHHDMKIDVRMLACVITTICCHKYGRDPSVHHHQISSSI